MARVWVDSKQRTLGRYDSDVAAAQVPSLSFVSPCRYHSATVHCVDASLLMHFQLGKYCPWELSGLSSAEVEPQSQERCANTSLRM